MISKRKGVRLLLKQCSREQFYTVIHSSKLTPEQENIISLYIIQGLSIYAIAEKVNRSEASVRKILSKIYDQIYPLYSTDCKLLYKLSLSKK